ncbi:hypothetical protein [Labrys monachus]|uniref:Uncharacterized protein n=1 Tax=Labrys monachus TaxID=217067 RepID=A0ABU0FBB3_9HYPH|nr:hypothetical protein [Labrys monachus]MDQ0391726.1 hypothetical protein [Labrys monachus]
MKKTKQARNLEANSIQGCIRRTLGGHEVEDQIMDSEGTRPQQPARPKPEKLEDRYGKIAMPALAAAVGVGRKETDSPRQMSAETLVSRLQQMAQS